MPTASNTTQSLPRRWCAAARWVVALVLLFLSSTCALVSATAADNEKAAPGTTTPPVSSKGSRDDVQALIRELGSPRYTARRAAANELRRIGADAFDALFVATEDPDPEVAASAHYLLREIKVRWVENDDPAVVRRLLRGYGEASDEVRLAAVGELSKLAQHEGLAALCRIVRYDRSPLVSRTAALAVIRPDLPNGRRTPVNATLFAAELGDSNRTAANWLRQFQQQLRDPAAATAAWRLLIDAEANLLDQRADETSPEVLIGLLWNLADIHRQLDDRPALAQAINRMFRVDTDDPDTVAIGVLGWLVEEKRWDAVDELLNSHRDRFTRSKKPLYSAAFARLEQGKAELAEELAEQASRLESPGQLGFFRMARELEVRDRYSWAIREYRRAIDGQQPESQEAVLARIALAAMLHDHQDEKQAAETVEPFVQALRTNGNLAQRYEQVRGYMQTRFELELPGEKRLSAQLHYYRACQFAAEKDWPAQRKELLAAIEADPSDADALISMYRMPDADEDWLADTRQRIEKLRNEFEKQIEASPNDPSAYNQWAWLVSNTEGDFQQAIRYSHRSLELTADDESAAASFLDTLGRCYFAAGDYENAVKYQRQAVEKMPYLKVMQRQLEFFEVALANSKTKAS
jgi:tetratricopeptide (TPR) repeat protein